MNAATERAAKGIGSVIPAADAKPGRGVGPTIWGHWTNGAPSWAAFATARAALSALLRHRAIDRLWLPAYGCRALAEGAAHAGVELAWYGVDEHLNADITHVRGGLAPGDAVLAVAWFGRPLDAAFHALAAEHPDLLLIEDRAQALYPGVAVQGSVHLYSPRKLLGVGDGGLLVGADLPPSPAPDAASDAWAPNDMRAIDAEGADPQSWFPLYQAREAAFGAEPLACTQRTLATLDGLPLQPEADQRRRNWRRLAVALTDIALWPLPAPVFAPLAFPVLVPDAAALVRDLAERRIWAARHWADIAAPEGFTAAHDLSRRCVSLPLDARYDERDMDRIVQAVLACLAKETPSAGPENQSAQ